MNFKPILIVAGEPNSVFLEIFLKSIKIKKFKNPIILIASLKLLQLQMRKLKVKKKINIMDNKNIKLNKIKKKEINLINVNYFPKKAFEKISKKSNNYISNSFKLAFELIKKFKINKFINVPVNKKNIIDKIKLIDGFYKTKFKKKPKIAVLGLNPHCESVDKYNEDEKIINPSIKFLKKRNFKVSGPHSADTIFLKNNRKNYDVILGMYHDQVLTPIKTLFEYDAINITLGLPFTRITPDHGPNQKMMGKNLSNPLSLIQAINFLEKN